MPYPTNEGKLVTQIVASVRYEFPRAYHLKTHGDGYQRPGVPDLLFCLDGTFIGIEIKHRKPGESIEHMLSRVTEVQRRELASIRESGGVASVAWSRDQVLAILGEGTLLRASAPQFVRGLSDGELLSHLKELSLI